MRRAVCITAIMVLLLMISGCLSTIPTTPRLTPAELVRQRALAMIEADSWKLYLQYIEDPLEVELLYGVGLGSPWTSERTYYTHAELSRIVAGDDPGNIFLMPSEAEKDQPVVAQYENMIAVTIDNFEYGGWKYGSHYTQYWLLTEDPTLFAVYLWGVKVAD
jgi:hypothetical protein